MAAHLLLCLIYEVYPRHVCVGETAYTGFGTLLFQAPAEGLGTCAPGYRLTPVHVT